MASFGTSVADLKEIYISFVRSILEHLAPVWHNSLSVEKSQDLERVQKSALRIMLGKKYTSYSRALLLTGLDSLEKRRVKLC